MILNTIFIILPAFFGVSVDCFYWSFICQQEKRKTLRILFGLFLEIRNLFDCVNLNLHDIDRKFQFSMKLLLSLKGILFCKLFSKKQIKKKIRKIIVAKIRL